MSRRQKIIFLWGITLLGIVITATIPRISQDNHFHQFADDRLFLGIPNALNVLSNLAFLFTGIWGLVLSLKAGPGKKIQTIYTVLFSGIILTCFGSAYYHLSPDNSTLVFDRLPMVIIFSSFLAATIAEWIDLSAGYRLLLPIVLAGIASVVWWWQSEQAGNGDLRFYGFVQYFPMLLIPLILWLFRDPQKSTGLVVLLSVIIWYVIAKLMEKFDIAIYHATGFISGHTLKHLAAAVATGYMVVFYQKRHRLQS